MSNNGLGYLWLRRGRQTQESAQNAADDPAYHPAEKIWRPITKGWDGVAFPIECGHRVKRAWLQAQEIL